MRPHLARNPLKGAARQASSGISHSSGALAVLLTLRPPGTKTWPSATEPPGERRECRRRSAFPGLGLQRDLEQPPGCFGAARNARLTSAPVVKCAFHFLANREPQAAREAGRTWHAGRNTRRHNCGKHTKTGGDAWCDFEIRSNILKTNDTTRIPRCSARSRWCCSFTRD